MHRLHVCDVAATSYTPMVKSRGNGATVAASQFVEEVLIELVEVDGLDALDAYSV